MGKPLTITRTDRASGELRAVSAKCRDGGQVRRLLALAMVLEGVPRTEAAVLGRRASEHCRQMAAPASPDAATATTGPSEEGPRSRDGF
jgi:hypothetical protein